LFKLAESHLALARSDVASDGIHTNHYDIDISLVFKQESDMLRFESALLEQVSRTNPNKRPRIIETKTDDKSSDDTKEIEELEVLEVAVCRKSLSTVPLTDKLNRIFHWEYSHDNELQTDNSPPCDLFSDAGSLSIYEPETVPITLETAVQMLENPTSEFFIDKNPEKAHIKDKAKSSADEEKDENNLLYLSRYVHEAFDGINTKPKNFPWFVVHYVTHDASSVDFGALRRLFEQNLQAGNPAKRYHRVEVQIEFYSDQKATQYSKYLRIGSHRVIPNDIKTWKLDLYFADPPKAKEYFDWKEKRTRKVWEDFNK
jgi:hypothetical protein